MNQYTQFTSGELSYVPVATYTAQAPNLPVYDGTNGAAFRTAFDALMPTQTFGAIEAFNYSFTKENEQKKYSMNCNNNLFLNTADDLVNITGTLLENVRIDTIAAILGAGRESVASAPVPVVAEAHGTGWTVGVPFKLDNKNGSGTIVTAITVYANAIALVNNTDYDTYVGNGENGEVGYTYIVPLTAQATAITADYTYTPSASEIMGKATKSNSVPVTAYKFVSCPYQVDDDLVTPWRRQYIYFTSCSLSGELAVQFFKQGDEFAGIEFNLTSDGGVFLQEVKKGATSAAV